MSKNEKRMSVEEAIAWANSPEGMAEIKRNLKEAREITETNEKCMTLSKEILEKPMTI